MAARSANVEAAQVKESGMRDGGIDSYWKNSKYVMEYAMEIMVSELSKPDQLAIQQWTHTAIFPVMKAIYSVSL